MNSVIDLSASFFYTRDLHRGPVAKSAKKIFDSVHGFIHLSPLEHELIDTIPFQRLRYIRQLGITYLVYPGASHSRLEHSLGVMHLASRIFDSVVEKEPFGIDLPDLDYWRQIVRFAALCHDLGHLPFSHVGEKRILPGLGHEEWTYKIITSSYLLPIWETLQKEFPGKEVVLDLAKTALGEKIFTACVGGEDFTAWERAMSAIVTGDVFGADRIDYLLRDAKCTGVSYGLFDYHQLIETLVLIPLKKGGEEILSLGIHENGITACEALLLARYFMFKRVYQYSSVKAFSYHTARLLEEIYRERGLLSSVEEYLSMSDNEVLSIASEIAKNPSHPAYPDANCLYLRNPRYSALACREIENEAQVEELRKRANIPEGELDWEFVRSKEGEIDFSVQSTGGRIVSARECTDVFLSPRPYCWVFLPSHHVGSFQEELQAGVDAL